MKTFNELWEEFEPNNKPYTLGIKPLIEMWFNRGAEEKEAEILEFADWIWSKERKRDRYGFPVADNIQEAFTYWKENVKK